MKKTSIGKSFIFGIMCSAAMTHSVLASNAHAGLSGEVKVWSWNIAAKSLQETVAAFHERYPDVEVIIEDLGNAQVFDRMVAACSVGGVGLPDVVQVENSEAEIFWSRFPACMVDLQEFGYDNNTRALFPEWKRVELELNDKAYAMPWDSGPVMMFYRRDYYQAAGVDPATIVTWDDFAAAGSKIQQANPGIAMTQSNIEGDSEYFRMIGAENNCSVFSADGQQITVNHPACAEALDVVKSLHGDGLLIPGDWNGKMQAIAAGTVATHMWGGWLEGSIRENAGESQSGLWGMYPMPTISTGRRAANSGGSALAIASVSENKQAAYAFIENALATTRSQIDMLQAYGLVPSLLEALEDPYVEEPNTYWGGQAIWADTLATLDNIAPIRGTPFSGDALPILNVVQLDYLHGKYDSANAALEEAARQISFATGLPVQ